MTTTCHPSLTICDHPIARHNLARLRDKNTPPHLFREALKRVAHVVIHHATESLPTVPVSVETPLMQMQGHAFSEDIPILILPILRAGLGMADVATELLPTARMYHIGLYRNEETLQPVVYYNKLPQNLNYAGAHLLFLDPMLATGGSAIAAVEMLSRYGVPVAQMTFACIIAAPEGVQALTEIHPCIRIFTGALDERLNEKGYILPGLGDAGDRLFGTL